jgi:calcineurin-like phosphoesterase
MPEDRVKLQKLGIDCFSGGNWSLYRDEAIAELENPDIPVIRPANYPAGTPGKGWKYIKNTRGDVLVVSLLGSIVGRDANNKMDNPLQVIDKILDANKAHPRAATIVNFHGDYSSEKRIIGYYLDGRVTAIVGDHWHVPTADAMVLPKGTAHMTDVGMCGTLHSSLGVKLDVVIPRWRDNQKNKNEIETEGPLQFNAALIETDSNSLAVSITPIQKILS